MYKKALIPKLYAYKGFHDLKIALMKYSPFPLTPLESIDFPLKTPPSSLRIVSFESFLTPLIQNYNGSKQ